MRKITVQLLNSIILILIVLPLCAEIILTDKEYKAILKRLKEDRKIIYNDDKRWKELKKSKPKINYTIEDEQITIQDIEIPVYKAKPLKYEVKFKVVTPEEESRWFPWTFMFCGTLETTYHRLADTKFTVYPDIKLGVQFFSLKRLGLKFKTPHLNLGFNLNVGIRSSGLSLSYTIPKLLKNTSIHVYVGVSYKAKVAYGLGISLNF